MSDDKEDRKSWLRRTVAAIAARPCAAITAVGTGWLGFQVADGQVRITSQDAVTLLVILACAYVMYMAGKGNGGPKDGVA